MSYSPVTCPPPPPLPSCTSSVISLTCTTCTQPVFIRRLPVVSKAFVGSVQVPRIVSELTFHLLLPVLDVRMFTKHREKVFAAALEHFYTRAFESEPDCVTPHGFQESNNTGTLDTHLSPALCLN